MHKHLPRLDRVWVEPPIDFITTCTERRRAIVTRDSIAEILTDEWRAGAERHRWIVGRYVIMPDHVHFFCTPKIDGKSLSVFVGAWKRWTSRRINALRRPGTASPATGKASPFWQAEFFDHLIRSD